MKKIGFIIGMMLLCSLTGTSWADKVYVSDSFKITLRSGPSIDNKIIDMLTSGQVLEMLGEEGEWRHVRIHEDEGESKEGWVLTRYIIERVPWEMQVNYFKRKNTELQDKLEEIQQKYDDAIKEKRDLSQNLKQTAGTLQGLEKDHAALKRGAEGFLKLKATYDSTRDSLQSTRKALQEVTLENENLRASQMNRWFATGALVLLCGLMIGVMIGRQQKKRRSLYS